MDLIERIKSAFNKSSIKDPVIELNVETGDNIFGYISSQTFIGKSEDVSQNLIWKILDENIPKEDLVRITAIINETPQERLFRINENKESNIVKTKYWYHITPALDKFWVFIDVAKLKKDDYKLLYIIINGKNDFKKAQIFNYPSSVVSWMGLEQKNVYLEFLNEVFESAKTEVQIKLIDKYDELEKSGVRGRENIFNYAYYNFELTKISERNIFLNKKEISFLKTFLEDIHDFEIFDVLQKIIKISEELNNSSKTL